MKSKDEVIKKNVVDHIYWDNRVDAANIAVKVDDGRVTLSGSAPTYFNTVCASDDAWSVMGVNQVQNDIAVQYPETIPIPSDQEIYQGLQTTLEHNPDIDASEIQLSVEDGVVTLEGSVDAIWKKLHVEDIVSYHIGVVEIRNRLAVVPGQSLLDKEIAQDIVNALEREIIIDQSGIDVKVENGVVTLAGTVDSPVERRAAERKIYYTPGVVNVENELLIMPK